PSCRGRRPPPGAGAAGGEPRMGPGAGEAAARGRGHGDDRLWRARRPARAQLRRGRAMNGISFWEASFLWRDPLIAAVLAALLCSFVGVYVVLRRSAFAGAAVPQAASLGVVVALLLPHLFGFGPPALLSGIVAGGIAAGLFGASRRGGGRVGVEASIALVWVLCGAFSLLLGTFLTHEYEQVHSILFGDAVAAPP